MTGYQEILTDPCYAGQIITFTFPHIGNVGANREDIETMTPAGARPGPARRHHRALELARDPAARRLAQVARPRRRRRRRHAAADAADPRRRRAQRRRRPCARRRASISPALKAKAARLARARRHGSRHRGHLPPELSLGRDALAAGPGLWPAGRAALPCRRRRLRRQAQHPALPRRAGARVTVVPATATAEEILAP